MRLLIKIFLIVSLNITNSALATSFSATAIQVKEGKLNKSKLYWQDGNLRFEYMEDGVSMAKIYNYTTNTITWLDNDNKFYLRQKITNKERLFPKEKKYKPCENFDKAECLFLKKSKINGRVVDKWLITIVKNGYDYHIFQWIDEKLKIIIKQENSDGSGLLVSIVENEKMNNRKVRKVTMVAYSASGEEKTGVLWYDNKLNIVIKQQYPDNSIDELTKIKITKVSKKLFARPKNYTLYQSNKKR